MYIRKRVPGKDDPFLVDMVVSNFQVRKNVIEMIINMANEVMIVCDSNDTIIGFVCYRFRIGPTIFVDYVVLDTKHQGKGIATSFLPVFESHLMKQGIRNVFGTVDEENTDALKTFQHWGFKVHGQLGSSIVIQKELTSSNSFLAPTGVRTNSSVRKLATPPSLR